MTLPNPMPVGADLQNDPDSFTFDFLQQHAPFEEKYGVFQSFDPFANILCLRFLGGDPGDYKFVLTHNVLGLINTVGLPLIDVNTYIDSITPASGSPNGGTIVTIEGGPFSFNGLENNVKIGDTDCLVLSSTKTTIVCQTEPKADGFIGPSESQELEVFLKAYEMAVCNDGNNCQFTWTETGVPSVSGLTTNFDGEYHHLCIQGGDFSSY